MGADTIAAVVIVTPGFSKVDPPKVDVLSSVQGPSEPIAPRVP